MSHYHYLFWDDSNIEHIARHNVMPDEVEQVVFSVRTRIRKGRGQNIYYILGQTEAGRYLFVVVVGIGDHIGRVITAREMTHKERRWHRS